MNPLKFRLWDPSLGWVTDDYVLTPHGKLLWWDVESGEYREGYGTNIEISYSTNFFDRYGKEIYQGDIIKNFGHQCAVVRENEMFGVKIKKRHFEPSRFISLHSIRTRQNVAVIGDIFENPEVIGENI